MASFRTVILLIVSMITLSLFCTIEQPQAPTWNLPITVPLINQSYYAHELTKEFADLYITDTNQIGFSIKGSIDTIHVDDLLKISDHITKSNIKLGNFEISIDESIKDSSVTFKQIWSQAQNYNGVYTVVPSFSFDQISSDNVTIDQFEYLKVESGKAFITITNRFPIPIGPIYLTFYDNNDNEMFQIYFPNIIESGSAVTQDIDLTDKYFSNIIHAEMSGQSDGSSGNMVFIDANNDLLIEAKLEELVVSEAKAKIKPINFSTRQSLQLVDEIYIQEARIQSGQLRLTLKNNIPLNLSVDLVYEDIFKNPGENLTHKFDLIYEQQSNETIDLTGCFMTRSTPAPSVNIYAMIKSYETGNELITLSSQDSIGVTVEVMDLKFERLKGIINEQQAELTKQTTSIDLPEELNNIKLQRAELRLSFHNQINLPIQAHLQLKGINSQHQEICLPLAANIVAGGENFESITTAVLNERNSQIIPFLNNFPSKLEITGNTNFGNGSSTGSIDSEDYLFVEYQISAPFVIRMQEKTIRPDTNEIIIKSENYTSDSSNLENTIDGELTKNLQQGGIFIAIHNHFPIGIKLKIYISETLARLHTNPDIVMGPITIQPGKLDNYGSVFQEILTEAHVDLSAEDLNIFKNNGTSPKNLFIAPEITLDETKEAVIINADDYIKISSYARLNVLISPK